MQAPALTADQLRDHEKGPEGAELSKKEKVGLMDQKLQACSSSHYICVTHCWP